jgi:NADPH2:quinone reductase
MDGRLVQIGFMSGQTEALVDFRTVIGRRLTITGSTLRPRTVDEKAQIASALRMEVWPLLERGLVKPIVHQVFPLARAADAHRLMESGAHIGKIVLDART